MTTGQKSVCAHLQPRPAPTSARRGSALNQILDPGGLRPKEESLVLVQAEGGSPKVVVFCSQAVWLVGLGPRSQDRWKLVEPVVAHFTGSETEDHPQGRRIPLIPVTFPGGP